ncbi:MAG: ABC transporter ATP-binding protein [Myxococcales bacterium]|nr:ABC transporter ATP-binding protein [Myxococcales bacterium]
MSEVAAPPALLVVEAVSRQFGARTAVAAVSLLARPGEIVGLLGPNGAGKTTLISMICGVLPPTNGRIAIGGFDVAQQPAEAKQRLGMVPQELAIYEELSSLQNLAYFASMYRDVADLPAAMQRALGIAGLWDRRHDRVSTFSGGMKRRLNVACALVHAPPLVVLDEPTVGIDPQSRAFIFDALTALRAAGTCILYTSHYMEEVEALCDRVAIMDHGALIAEGTVTELRLAHTAASLEGVFLQLTGRTLRE